MLHAALQAEVEEHLARYENIVDENGRRVVVRNGSQPKRAILTGAGPIVVERPRVDDRALESIGKERFTSRILPKFMRRAPSIDALVPHAVSARYFHRRLSHGAGSDSRTIGERPFGEHRRAAQGDLD